MRSLVDVLVTYHVLDNVSACYARPAFSRGGDEPCGGLWILEKRGVHAARGPAYRASRRAPYALRAHTVRIRCALRAHTVRIRCALRDALPNRTEPNRTKDLKRFGER